MLAESESPSYLLSRGEKGKAEASAKALWGEHYSNELYGAGSPTTDLESGVDMLLPTRAWARALFICHSSSQIIEPLTYC